MTIRIQPVSGATIRDVTSGLNRLEKRTLPRAAATALNRTNRANRGFIVKAFSKRFRITQKRLRRRIIIPRNMRATPSKLSTGGVELVALVPAHWITPVTQLKAGARIGGGSGQVLDGAFVAEMPNGLRGVFRRKPGRRRRTKKSAKGTSRPGLPIQMQTFNLNGPAETLTHKVLITTGSERFAREYRSALAHFLRQQGFR